MLDALYHYQHKQVHSSTNAHIFEAWTRSLKVLCLFNQSFTKTTKNFFTSIHASTQITHLSTHLWMYPYTHYNSAEQSMYYQHTLYNMLVTFCFIAWFWKLSASTQHKHVAFKQFYPTLGSLHVRTIPQCMPFVIWKRQAPVCLPPMLPYPKFKRGYGLRRVDLPSHRRPWRRGAEAKPRAWVAFRSRVARDIEAWEVGGIHGRSWACYWGQIY